MACTDGKRCIEKGWVCDWLDDCTDKSDEETYACNAIKGCCSEGLIFNTIEESGDRKTKLGERNSKFLGFYKNHARVNQSRFQYSRQDPTNMDSSHTLYLDWIEDGDSCLDSK